MENEALLIRLYVSALELRTQQKRYFRSRLQSDLSRARLLESQFDELLDSVALSPDGVPVARPVQQTLF